MSGSPYQEMDYMPTEDLDKFKKDLDEHMSRYSEGKNDKELLDNLIQILGYQMVRYFEAVISGGTPIDLITKTVDELQKAIGLIEERTKKGDVA